ncbi:Hpt domain-containing protein [Arenimonas fontis]|uniref:Hpt domain-containing protein n=2 Tax=Arenimonas fontis TaxID=2608255 RepID=A0A5B2ZB29_9GAMM|nr:Hpt domain-containing protein [Arenimonas fontis]
MAPVALSTSYLTGSASLGISMTTLISFGTSRPVGTRSSPMGYSLASLPGGGRIAEKGRKDTGKAWSPHSEPVAGRARQAPAKAPELHRHRPGAPAMADAQLDPKALELLRMLDRDRPGAFSEFVRMFVHEAPELVKKMEQAQAAGDPDALGKSAHYLRSAALAMGATGLVDVCHSLEHLDAAQLSGPDMPVRMDELRRRTRDALILLLQEVPQI